MLFWTIVKVGLRSLLASKLRSFLAMLGIIIGVASVVAMLSIGAGAKASVLGRLSSMGTNLLVVRPGSRGFRGVSSGTQQNLTLEDATAIVGEVEGIERISPVVSGSVQAKRLNKNARATVNGVAATWTGIRDFTVEKGRGITEAEAESTQRVAVLGPSTADTLFEGDDPVGQTVKLNGINFRVVGVLKSKGDQGMSSPDEQILIPYTTAMKQVFGLENLREIDIQAADGADLSVVQQAVSKLLRKRHKLADDADDDFNVQNQAEMIQTFSDVSQTFTVLLGGIAGISLLVGGIGIMNIMLVTVTERTREIGIRKAIGAKRSSILAQFLIESVIVSGLGGVIGVLLGAALAGAIGAFSPFPAKFELPSALLALSFAAFVGVFFGLYPARRASHLNPIEALRYE